MQHIVITEGSDSVSEVLIGTGILSDLPDLLPRRDDRKRVAIITQPTVRRIAERLLESLQRRGLFGAVVPIPDGEAAKTLATVESAALRLNDLGFGRRDTIVGVGGGAATDVAGFLAAVYLRGVECIAVPTTLLGAVDAAVGGKTGVNVGGKNLIGAFAHPALVVIDVDVVRTVPLDVLRQGTAEALKAGLIGDRGLVDLYYRHGIDAPLDEVIERAVRVKAGVVSQDLREGGVRAYLNYGHTIGHAVEIAAGVSHGEAVAIGMVAAGVVGERTVGFARRSEQAKLIAAVGLPVRSPSVDGVEIARLMALDKKRDGAGLRFVVLEDFGVPRVVHPDAATVRAALNAVGID